MFSLSVQALGGHVYTVPVSSSTTVRDVKQKIRCIDEDWKGTGVSTPITTAPTRRASQSTIPEFHDADEPSRITPPEKDTLEPMEVIQEEDPYSEMDTLLTPDGQPLIDSDPIEKYLPTEGMRQRQPSIITKDDPTSPKVLYRLKSYPSYGDYIQVQMRRWQMDKGWKGIAMNFTLITLAALFLAAMAQASFNLPKSWSDYLELTYIVAVTFQTFAVLLSASLLGAYRSTLSVIMYLLMICAGAPFGALQKGGYKVLYGGTAGYLYGYIFASMLVGYLASRGWDRRYRTIILSMFLGNVVIYICGLLYMPFGRSFQSNPHKTPKELYCGKPHGCVGQVFYDGLIPFIPGDLIKIGIASAILPLGWKFLGWRASQRQRASETQVQQKEAIEMA